MRFLIQPYNCCGQTCIAMIADISIDEAIQAYGKKGLSNIPQIIKTLRKLGYNCPDKMIRKNAVEGFRHLEKAIVKLKYGQHWKSHLVVWNGVEHKFYDPDNGIKDIITNGKIVSYLPIYYALPK